MNKQGTQNIHYQEMKQLIGWLRGEVLYAAELAIGSDHEKFQLLRKRFLQLFGEARGAERKLKEIFNPDQSRIGQSGNNSEICGKEDEPMSG